MNYVKSTTSHLDLEETVAVHETRLTAAEENIQGTNSNIKYIQHKYRELFTLINLYLERITNRNESDILDSNIIIQKDGCSRPR